MNVYPTRRSAAWPRRVLAEVKQQAPLARTDGDRLLDVGRSAVPFPITADPLQMMWNHTLRWRGGSVKREFVWVPVTSSGRYFTVRVLEQSPSTSRATCAQPRPNRLSTARHVSRTGEHRGAADADLGAGRPGRARVARPGRTRPLSRRVLRVPSLAYDDLDPRTQGLRTTDQYDGWNGAPDLYDWKLLGKREMFIPYNSYKLARKQAEVRRHSPARSCRPRTAALRTASGLGHRGHPAPGQPPPLPQAHLLPGRGHLAGVDGGGLRQRRHAVALRQPPGAAVLRRAGALVRGHDPLRLQGRRLPGQLSGTRRSCAWTWGWKGEINDFLPGNLRRLGTR